MVRTQWSPQLASQVSRLKPTGLLCMGMDERTGLQCEGGNARCIAWSYFACRRPHQKQSAEAATSNSRSSQPSGNLCCGWRWHFRKPALSTDQFKLKERQILQTTRVREEGFEEFANCEDIGGTNPDLQLQQSTTWEGEEAASHCLGPVSAVFA